MVGRISFTNTHVYRNSDDSGPADQPVNLQYTYQRGTGHFPQARIKLLVVEDDDEDWQLIQQAFLECLPQTVVIRAATAHQALTLLEDTYRVSADRPQLILMDLCLPTRDIGPDLLKQLKGVTSFFKNIPLIILSQSGEATDISECYAAGATSYRQKSSDFTDWVVQFTELRKCRLETVSLPPGSATYASKD